MTHGRPFHENNNEKNSSQHMDQEKEVILSLPKKETWVTRQEDEMK